jgi:branched-chain amino acid transport system permease protein
VAIFIQQVVTGVMTGSLYALLALALVLIVRSTSIINFAQGEMATFSAYIGWVMTRWFPYPIAFVVAVAAGFLVGAITERVVIRAIEGREELVAVIVTLGLFLMFNSFDLSAFGAEAKALPQPFQRGPVVIDGVVISAYSIFVFIVSIVLMLALFLFFQRTRLGLALRATAADRTAAELAGVSTNRMLMIGWGLAGALGAVAAMLIAPIVVLTPNLMFFLLIFAFAAAVLGGIDSAIGALVGGVFLGVTQNLVGTYLGDVVRFLHIAQNVPDSNQYRDIVALSLILVILAVRPRGIFGRVVREKV